MIVYPGNWREIGTALSLTDIDSGLREVVRDIDCTNLSYSGGVDSSLLLHYILETKGEAKAFTMANDANHPDIVYSRRALIYFEKEYGIRIDHQVFVRPRLESDTLVESFYKALSGLSIERIIAGDCIDEFACGYYKHQDLKEETYQSYLSKLQSEQLEPLNQNSGDIKVYLPFADDRILKMLYRIPLYAKVSPTCRKIIIMRLAEGKMPQEIIERRKYGFGTSAISENL